LDLARTSTSVGQLSNVWGLVQPQRHYFTLAVPASSNAGGVASCLHPAHQRRGRHVDVETPRRPSATALENILQGLCAICSAPFEVIVAEPARLAYSVHWRADDENPALAIFLKVLGERYPLPIVGG
jgi:hypothetical protein